MVDRLRPAPGILASGNGGHSVRGFIPQPGQGGLLRSEAELMPDLKLSTKKLNALQYACLQNALRLHFDSVVLTRGGSFASAFAISVIASEELGKAFGIAELIFQAGFDKGRLYPRACEGKESVALRSQTQARMVRKFVF